MKYTLNSPITVGNLSDPILVDQLELVSFSVNFEPYYSNNGTAILSVVLMHRPSGYKVNYVFNDATSLAGWNTLDSAASITESVFARLQAEGKLPAGQIVA